MLIDCADEKGLVHKISGVLFGKSCNIISNREFVDIENEHFYMRTEFEGEADKEEIINELRELLPENARISVPNGKKKDVVVLVTKEHHCLAELLIRNQHNELNFSISAVIGNHDDCQGLVKKFGIPFKLVSHEGLSREEHEKQVLEELTKYNPDYVVLAKYMRVLSEDFVKKHQDKIINIHHSFLPAFIGANPYRQAHKRGVKVIGATAHFVTSELDKGPIIAQDVISINHTFDVPKMKAASHDIEKIILVRALRLLCEDKIFLNGNKTIVFE